MENAAVTQIPATRSIQDFVEPNYPLHLDTVRQREDFEAVTNPRLIETFLKLHGLFSRNLIINDNQILDHAGMRKFLFKAQSLQEFESLCDYLTDQGGDLKTPPLVVTTEYDPAAPQEILPLRALLERKLGVGNSERTPWALSSVWPTRRRDELNSQIRKATADRRLEMVIQNADPSSDQFRQYLKLASRIWDRSDNRINLRAPDYRSTLIASLEAASSAGSKLSGKDKLTADRLHEMLSQGFVILDGEKIKQIDRTTLTHWVNSENASQPLREIVNRAHPEAFLRAVSPTGGVLSANGWRQFGWGFRGWMRQPLPVETLEEVAREASGPLRLDNLTFTDLLKLRNTRRFQDSLNKLTQKWREGQDHAKFCEVLRDHVDTIYEVLGEDKRPSSPIQGGESLLRVKVLLFDSVTAALGTLPELVRGLGYGDYAAYTLGAIPIWFVVQGIYEFFRPSNEQRGWRELANRIGSAAMPPRA